MDIFICLNEVFLLIIFSKNHEICSGSNVLFRGSTFDFLSSSIHSIVKRKAHSTFEQKSEKVSIKRD